MIQPNSLDLRFPDRDNGSTPTEEWWISETAPGNDGLGRVCPVRAVLSEHPDKILVLPGGRRVPIDMLLEHLASGTHEWTEKECEVCFAATIDPHAAAGPWLAPDRAPCWSGLQGPLFHLWVTRGTPPRRELLGLIIPDQRSAPRVAEI